MKTTRLTTDHLRVPLGKPARVLVLGLTFKENIPDLRNSKVVDIVAALKERGHTVTVHDAFADAEEAEAEYGIALAGDLAKLKGFDALVGAVTHAPYAAFTAADFARLMDVSPQSVYNWERRVTRPRAAQLKTLAELRGMGKKETAARLEELDGKGSAQGRKA